MIKLEVGDKVETLIDFLIYPKGTRGIITREFNLLTDKVRVKVESKGRNVNVPYSLGDLKLIQEGKPTKECTHDRTKGEINGEAQCLDCGEEIEGIKTEKCEHKNIYLRVAKEGGILKCQDCKVELVEKHLWIIYNIKTKKQCADSTYLTEKEAEEYFGNTLIKKVAASGELLKVDDL